MSYIGIEPVNNKPIFRFGCRMPGKQVTKNLFRGTIDFGDDTECDEDAIKVFLRIKPSINENEDIIQKLDDKTIVFKMPPDLTQSRKKLNIPVQYKYTFSNIFPSTVTQGEIFSGCVANHAKDLFNGQHCLLFTYGTTNAGKTFTVLGTGDQPGIIPRTLTTVFKSIKGKEYCNDRIIPCMFNSAFEIESAKTLESERLFKSNILNWNPDKTQGDSYRSQTCKSHISNQSSVDEILGEAVFQQMQKRLTNDTSIIEYAAEPDDRFSVWVSFAEIYNEAIYDLLQPVPSNGKRAQLKLAQDNHKNTYIKGLCQVNVQSEEEAYKVLLFGKNNLQVAATGLNLRSSRSHCIFSIKLMKCPNVEHPEKVVVSSFSICDLAGAERQKKTLNIGIRLKESQNINCSLHVLSRCFSIIRENQLNNEHKLIPFRDSKLTQLFQHALLGKESVTMIVNVNSDRDLCEETQHVLKASAIAKHIIVQSRPVVRPRPTRTSTFSQLIRKKTNRSSPIRWDSCIKAKAADVQSLSTIDDSAILEGEQSNLEKQEQKYQNLLMVIESLKEKLKEEKDKNLQFRKTWKLREDEVREEMHCELQHLLKSAEEQNALDAERVKKRALINRNDGRVINPEIHVKKPKLNNILEEYEEDITTKCDTKNLKDEVMMQQKEIDGLTHLVNIYIEEKRELTMELTSSKLQLGWKDREILNLKNKLEMFAEESNVHAAYLDLEKEMESRRKELNVLLEEARNDLLEELSNNEDLETEVVKLEKELTEKDEEIATLQTKIDDLRQEIDIKTHTMDMIDSHAEELETKLEKEKEALGLLNSENDELKTSVTYLNAQILILTDELTAYRKDVSDKKCEQALQEENKLVTVTNQENIHTPCFLENQLKQLEEIYQTKLFTQDDLDEEIVKLTVTLSDDLNNKFQIKSNAHERTIANLLEQINETNKEKSYLYEELGSAKSLLIKFELDLSNKTEQISSLQQKVDYMDNVRKETEMELNLEISRLEQSSKSQAQDVIKLNNEIEVKYEEMKSLSRTIECLKGTLKAKEHDLECNRNKMVGYERSVPALQTEFDRQQKETADYKRKCDDLQATIFNLEQERHSFLTNQKDIIGKYEDQLKKTKEENETLKKEVARVTSTFYKSTPTPKKDLEKQVKVLKKQLEEERANIQLLEKENIKTILGETSCQTNDICTAVNTDNYMDVTAQEKLRNKVRTRAKSHCDMDDEISKPDYSRSKSASKPRPQRALRSTKGQNSCSRTENEARSNDKPKKQVKKKLHIPSSCCDLDNDATDYTDSNDDGIESLSFQSESPWRTFKRNLRPRKE